MTRSLRSNSGIRRNSLSARGTGHFHMRNLCIGVALCVCLIAMVTFGGEKSSLMSRPRGVEALESLIEKDDPEAWKALGMGSKEFEEGEELSAFDRDPEEISRIFNNTSLANETVDFSTFETLTAGSQEFTNTFSSCILIQHYICPAASWVCTSPDCKNILIGGVHQKLNVQLVPVTKTPSEDRFYIKHCASDNSTRFLSTVRGVAMMQQEGEAGTEKFKIGVSRSLVNGLGFYIATDEETPTYLADKGGRVMAVSDPKNSQNKGTWSLLPDLPDWVHFLEAIPKYTSVKGHGGNGCIRRYRGCCFPKRFLPKLRKPSADEKPIIAPLITSSKATLPGRIDVLERWLFKGSLRPVISTDCFMPTMFERLVKNRPSAWLVGPTGPSVRGHAEVVLRVSLAVHWVVHNMDIDWFFVCDDDTLVFPENLLWAAAHFPNPRDVPYYVGHTTEWHRKSKYHGDMAFGGGGVLSSAAIQKAWAKKWNNMPKDAINWLDSGNWNHAGGDGAVCRLMVWLMRDTYGADHGFYAETRGFHQFDLIGNDHILNDVSRTCPKCPPIFDQIGHWMDSAISEHPVITLHHLGGIRHGSVYPNLNGPQTMMKLYDGYYAVHHHLFLRRVCTSDPTNSPKLTFCINFGRSVQIYSESVTPEVAMNVMLYSDYKGRPNPELLFNLKIPSEPEEGHIETAYFEFSDSEKRQIYRPTEATPAPTPVRKSDVAFVKEIAVAVSIESQKAELSATLADGKEVTVAVSIAALLSPEVSLSEG